MKYKKARRDSLASGQVFKSPAGEILVNLPYDPLIFRAEFNSVTLDSWGTANPKFRWSTNPSRLVTLCDEKGIPLEDTITINHLSGGQKFYMAEDSGGERFMKLAFTSNGYNAVGQSNGDLCHISPYAPLCLED